MADGPAEMAYAVWLRGRGWLKDDKGNAFADLNREIAESAAALWGKGAEVMPFDQALLDLEPVFLQRERAAGWRAFWNGILGRRPTPTE